MTEFLFATSSDTSLLYGPNTVRQVPKIRAENPIENPIEIRTPKSTENRSKRNPRIAPKSAEIRLGRHFRCLGTQNGASGAAFRKNIEIRSDSGTPLESEKEVFVKERLKFALSVGPRKVIILGFVF